MATEPTIDTLVIDISTNLDTKAAGKVSVLAQSLERLRLVITHGFDGMVDIARNLSVLSNVDMSATNGINKMAEGLERLKAINLSGFTQKTLAIVKAFSVFQTLDLAGIKTASAGISTFARGVERLQKADVPLLAQNVPILINALKPLIDEMIRGGSAIGNFGTQMLAMAAAAKMIAPNMNDAKKSTTGLLDVLKSGYVKAAGLYRILRKGWNLLQKSFEVAADYTERLNLFQVTFGGTHKEQFEWVTNLAGSLGLSNKELLKSLGLFKQFATSLGLVDETGTALAKTLTQLSLDFASFYNLSIEASEQAIQSMIFAGQVKPGRTRFGIDVSAQTLDNMLLLNERLAQFGVTSRQLTQSQKVILRTIQTLEAGSNAFGNMGREIDNSASQVRIMTASFENLQLAIGDFINGAGRGIIQIISGIAMGITFILRAFKPLQDTISSALPEGNLLGEVNEELEDTAANLGLLDFDKFNVLDQKSDLSENAEITAELTRILEEQSAKYDEIFNKAIEISTVAGEIGTKIRDWFINVDVDGKFESWTEKAKLLLAAIVAIFAPAVITGFAKLGLSILGVTGKVSALTIASSLLRTTGIFLLIYGLMKMVEAIKNGDTGFAILYGTVVALGALLVVFSNKTILQTTIKAIKTLIEKNALATKSFYGMEKAALATKLACTALGIGIGYLIGQELKKIEPEARGVIGIFLTLTGVVFALAIAVMNLQSAWTLGIAAAAITAGIIAMTSVVEDSKNKAKNATQYFANGGIPDTRGGSAFVMNENGKPELIHENSRGQVEISNQESLRGAFLSALRQYGAESAYSNGARETTETIDVATVSGDVLFELIKSTAQRKGYAFAKVGG